MDESTQKTEHDEFSKLKDAFDRLQFDEKAAFLITKSVNTAAEAVFTLIEAVTRECSQLFGTETEKRSQSKTSQNEDAS